MSSNKKNPEILIVGLGNFLLRDDGVGVHAINELKKESIDGVTAVEVGTAVLDALHLFESADKILAIDAMRAGGKPGTLYSIAYRDIRVDMQQSLHELNLVAALRFLQEDLKAEIFILGVEPEVIEYGFDLSDSVQASMPLLLEEVKKIVDKWLKEKKPDYSAECLDTSGKLEVTI